MPSRPEKTLLQYCIERGINMDDAIFEKLLKIRNLGRRESKCESPTKKRLIGRLITSVKSEYKAFVAQKNALIQMCDGLPQDQAGTTAPPKPVPVDDAKLHVPTPPKNPKIRSNKFDIKYAHKKSKQKFIATEYEPPIFGDEEEEFFRNIELKRGRFTVPYSSEGPNFDNVERMPDLWECPVIEEYEENEPIEKEEYFWQNVERARIGLESIQEEYQESEEDEEEANTEAAPKKPYIAWSIDTTDFCKPAKKPAVPLRKAKPVTPKKGSSVQETDDFGYIRKTESEGNIYGALPKALPAVPTSKFDGEIEENKLLVSKEKNRSSSWRVNDALPFPKGPVIRRPGHKEATSLSMPKAVVIDVPPKAPFMPKPPKVPFMPTPPKAPKAAFIEVPRMAPFMPSPPKVPFMPTPPKIPKAAFIELPAKAPFMPTPPKATFMPTPPKATFIEVRPKAPYTPTPPKAPKATFIEVRPKVPFIPTPPKAPFIEIQPQAPFMPSPSKAPKAAFIGVPPKAPFMPIPPIQAPFMPKSPKTPFRSTPLKAPFTPTPPEGVRPQILNPSARVRQLLPDKKVPHPPAEPRQTSVASGKKKEMKSLYNRPTAVCGARSYKILPGIGCNTSRPSYRMQRSESPSLGKLYGVIPSIKSP